MTRGGRLTLSIIGLALIGGFCGAASLCAAGPTSPLVLVSDIDDTVKITRIRSDGHYGDLMKNVYANRAFVGMPELYQSLRSGFASVHYVTSTLPVLKPWVQRFLHENGFPLGRTWVRSSLKIRSVDYKFNTIRDLMLRQPDKRFVLVGDDGEHDAEVFTLLIADPQVGPRVEHSYVHTLYGSHGSAPTSKGPTPYYTALDLAVDLRGRGFIDDEKLKPVLGAIDRAVRAGQVNQVLPDFVKISPIDLRAASASVTASSDPELRSLGREILPALERQASRAGSCPTLLQTIARALKRPAVPRATH